MSRVALFRGENRYNNIIQALDRITADVDLSHRQRVLIKPNLGSPTGRWPPPM